MKTQKIQYLYIPNVTNFLNPQSFMVFCSMYTIWANHKHFTGCSWSKLDIEKIRQNTSLSNMDIHGTIYNDLIFCGFVVIDNETQTYSIDEEKLFMASKKRNVVVEENVDKMKSFIDNVAKKSKLFKEINKN